LTSKAAPFRVERLLQRGVDVGLEEERERGSGRGHCVVFVSEKEKRFVPRAFTRSAAGALSLALSFTQRGGERGFSRCRGPVEEESKRSSRREEVKREVSELSLARPFLTFASASSSKKIK